MHPIERAVLDLYTGKDIPPPVVGQTSPPKMNKLALGILELERVGTQLVPKSYLSNTATPASFEGGVKEPWKGFFHNFV